MHVHHGTNFGPAGKSEGGEARLAALWEELEGRGIRREWTCRHLPLRLQVRDVVGFLSQGDRSRNSGGRFS